MKPALLSRQPRYPANWEAIPCGQATRQLIEQTLAPGSRHWFGYHLVKLGALSAALQLPDCPIQHQVGITLKQAQDSLVMANSRSLPLLKRSIDALILSFELDFAQDPHQILREANRVMMPDGHLVIIGYNPFSLAGLAKYLPWRRDSLLHDARCFSTVRIKDWLHLLGFEIIEEHGLVHSELLFERSLHPQSKWQRWASRYCQWMGSVYIVVAKKREIPLSPLKMKWKPKAAFNPAGAGLPTSRVSSR
ncbi:methyltransferase domain-containing protein [Lacimicrobium sp. SS2-24]|uniref:class I SAM-dependent methyltransferase n=1 Tax=Lacimicrobium sp. SS2-24 TaxID=2005569 RepID=UPI000B4B1F48|nr:methyltransferase domain-containing protein [Lacimicrobium sp. SS2-24]